MQCTIRVNHYADSPSIKIKARTIQNLCIYQHHLAHVHHVFLLYIILEIEVHVVLVDVRCVAEGLRAARL